MSIVAMKARKGAGEKGTQEGGDVNDQTNGNKSKIVSFSGLFYSKKPIANLALGGTCDLDDTDVGCPRKRVKGDFEERRLFSLASPTQKHVNPHGGKTTNWRAGCGRSACPVRREGESKPIGSSYPLFLRSAQEQLRTS